MSLNIQKVFIQPFLKIQEKTLNLFGDTKCEPKTWLHIFTVREYKNHFKTDFDLTLKYTIFFSNLALQVMSGLLKEIKFAWAHTQNKKSLKELEK